LVRYGRVKPKEIIMATNVQDQTNTTSGTNANSMDSIKNALGNNQMVNKATEFAKARPWASAALAGVVGVALLNTLRGKGGARR
jgi:ElaB/YqjD/DUF883 family membrane-anchored ribosome-binding protein